LHVNCAATLSAPENAKSRVRIDVLAWAFKVERVTGIEPALSAWEVTAGLRVRPAGTLTCGKAAEFR
jgi:hypothetical protein